MLLIFRESNEHVSTDIHLNYHFEGKAIMYSNGTVDGRDEMREERFSDMGFHLSTSLPYLQGLMEKIDEDHADEILIDRLAEWVLGINPEGNTVEEIYSESTEDELREFIFFLLRKSNSTKVGILANDILIQFISECMPHTMLNIIDE